MTDTGYIYEQIQFYGMSINQEGISGTLLAGLFQKHWIFFIDLVLLIKTYIPLESQVSKGYHWQRHLNN